MNLNFDGKTKLSDWWKIVKNNFIKTTELINEEAGLRKEEDEALEERVNTTIGVLESLDTEDKDSLVTALNEVRAKAVANETLLGDFNLIESGEYGDYKSVIDIANGLNGAMTDEVTARIEAVAELNEKFGTEQEERIKKDSQLETMIGENSDHIVSIKDNIGDMETLQSADGSKTLVGAVNAAEYSAGLCYEMMGNASGLETDDKSNVVNAVNEVNRKTKSFIEYNGKLGSETSIKGFTLGTKAVDYRITPKMPTSGTTENPIELKPIENIIITDWTNGEEMLYLQGINIYPGDCLSYSEGIIRDMDMLTLDGSEKWNLHEKGFFYTVNNTISRPTSNANVAIIRSSHFSEVSFNNIGYTSSAPADKSIAMSGTASGANWLCIRYREKTTVEEFKEWLSQNPVTVLYRKTARTIENIEMPDFVFSNTECEATYVKGKKVNYTYADVAGVTGDVDAHLLYEADVDIAHAVEIYEIEQALISLGANI